ncbi:MAG: ABC transporter permease [Micromonosporaceae bacterium]
MTDQPPENPSAEDNPDAEQPEEPTQDKDGGVATESRDDVPGRVTYGRAFLDALTTANSGTVTVLALVLALLVGAVIIVFSDEAVLATFQYLFARPTDALYAVGDSVGGAYGALFKGSIVNFETLGAAFRGEVPWERALDPISETLTNSAPLIFTGLAVTLAFRAGLINIGGEGQAIMGAIAAGMVGFLLHLPPVIHLLAALVAGAIAGGMYGFVPGWLKARTGAHEVITTIMLNHIAKFFLGWLLLRELVQRPEKSNAISKVVDENAMLPKLAGEVLRVNLGIVLAIFAALVVGWILQRSTLGFELRAVGSNPDAARTAGMSVNRAYMVAMMLAGGFAGLGGAAMLLGPAGSLTPAVVAGIGFDGITVALLGRGKPVGTVLAGLLFGALQAGAVGMQGQDVPVDMVTILQALIVLFIAAPALVKAVFRLREQRAAGFGPTLAKGW